MTSYDNEATMIRNGYEDNTQIVDNKAPSSDEKERNELAASSPTDTDTDTEKGSTHKTAKKVGGIAVGGILLGTATSVFMDVKGASTEVMPEPEEEEDETGMAEDGILLPEIDVVALGITQESPVNDGMTFEEAFSAAREAMGSGSAFEWHGNIYATYTQEEWTDMTHEQKSDFYATLNIPNPFSSADEMEVAVEDAPLNTETLYAENAGSKTEEMGIAPDSNIKPEDTVTAQLVQPDEDAYGEDIPVVSVGNAEGNDNDIQILGVTQDISTGYNVGHLSVDGEEVVVIDVDGDMVFDSMVADLNHDGDITSGEIIDISQQHLSLNDFQGRSDIFNSLTSTGDTPDYLSEMVE